MAADDELDPSANTAMFQAFVDRGEPERKSSLKPIALGVAAVVALALIVVLIAQAL